MIPLQFILMLRMLIRNDCRMKGRVRHHTKGEQKTLMADGEILDEPAQIVT